MPSQPSDPRGEATHDSALATYSEVCVAAALKQGPVHVCVEEGALRWPALAATIWALLADSRGPVALFARRALWPMLRRSLDSISRDTNTRAPGAASPPPPVCVLPHEEELPRNMVDSVTTSVIFLLDIGASKGHAPVDFVAFGSAVVDVERLTAPMLRVLRGTVLGGPVALFTPESSGVAERLVAANDVWRFRIFRLPFRPRAPPSVLLPCTLTSIERRGYFDAFASVVETADAPIRTRHALMQLCASVAEREGIKTAQRMHRLAHNMERAAQSQPTDLENIHDLPAAARAFNRAVHESFSLLGTVKDCVLRSVLTFYAESVVTCARGNLLDVNLLVVVPVALQCTTCRHLALADESMQMLRVNTRLDSYARHNDEVAARVNAFWAPSADLRAARVFLLGLRRSPCGTCRRIYNEGVLPSSLPVFLTNVRVLVADKHSVCDLMLDVMDKCRVSSVFFAFPGNIAHAWPRDGLPLPRVTAATWPVLWD